MMQRVFEGARARGMQFAEQYQLAYFETSALMNNEAGREGACTRRRLFPGASSSILCGQVLWAKGNSSIPGTVTRSNTPWSQLLLYSKQWYRAVVPRRKVLREVRYAAGAIVEECAKVEAVFDHIAKDFVAVRDTPPPVLGHGSADAGTAAEKAATHYLRETAYGPGGAKAGGNRVLCQGKWLNAQGFTG